MSNRPLKFLDGVRGLAAFWVVAGHARWLLWEGYSQYQTHPEQYPLPAKILTYALSVFTTGHEAVMLFFVLSGFVIHLRYAQKLKTQPQTAAFGWRSYVIRRMTRLYPPLLFAMFLTLILDSIGQSMNYSIYAQQTPYPQINSAVTSHHGVVTALGTVAFLGRVYVPDWGTNGALWSLTYEWWFYMIYPLFWYLSRKSMIIPIIILVVLFILSFFRIPQFLLLFQLIFSRMIVWWFGVLLADIYVGRLSIRLEWLTCLVLPLPFILVFTRILHQSLPGSLADACWGLGFMGLIAGLLCWEKRGGTLRLLEFFKPLGDFSYTLYVIHLPILVLGSGFLISQNNLLPRYFDWFLVGIIVSLCVAYVLHFVVEKPFTRKRTFTKLSENAVTS